MLTINQYTFGGSTPPPVATPNIKYGALYNWYAASNPLFAPVGWHIPTTTEFNLINTTLISEVGNKLKEVGVTYWLATNEGTNEVGFNGKGSGARSDVGEFLSFPLQWTCYFKTTTTGGFGNFCLILSYGSSNFNTSFRSNVETNKSGSSFRFLADNPLVWNDGDTLTDLDGNVYRTTKIGDQVWLADNWACTKLSNGTPIPNVTDDTTWAGLSTGAYCWYNNDITNGFLP